jgi:uncharacterized NAD-dependent epimerase/dehydratase family protein
VNEFRRFAVVGRVGCVDRVFAGADEDWRAAKAERVDAEICEQVGPIDAGNDDVISVGASKSSGASAFAGRDEVKEGCNGFVDFEGCQGVTPL